ncbi:MAG TPA: SUMF1/EgtB/PvdO family nonheme iron enzyme [Polyangiaceae bacterium]|nr:SUMF1/EgtB/PvdO family nonheme iron enzyme [Polyangiaceae bacterium]
MRSFPTRIALIFVAACSAAPPEPLPSLGPPPPPPRPSAPPVALQPPAAPTAPSAAPSSAPGDATASAPEAPPEPSACPSEMKLVDGTYCTEVEQKCLKSWHDESNDKTICEQFEPKTTCVGDRVKKRYCIDTYEWPNVKGERPEVMNRFHQAQVKCAAVGKRLCTESEWTMACEGPEMTPYPYGYVRDAAKCNGDHPWDGPNMERVAERDPKELARLWKGVRSGSQPNCISAYGVADLPANADEIASNEQKPGSKRAKFDSVTTGGPWYKGVRNQCRPKIYTHDEGFYYYYLSFRCCAEADGKPTDPRTPQQIAKGWKMDRVERSAQFTIGQMREKLELKKEGKCSCPERNILCKTMCGTLLGPNAVDATR